MPVLEMSDAASKATLAAGKGPCLLVESLDIVCLRGIVVKCRSGRMIMCMIGNQWEHVNVFDVVRT